MNPNLNIEQDNASEIVAGVDEAGRGPLAGPVVAAAVVVNQSIMIDDIKDSKVLSKSKRESCYDKITNSYHYSIGIASVQEIDKYNILEATKLACIRAVKNLAIIPTKVVVDGNMNFTDNGFISIVRGDQICYSIASASIVAKVTRDRMMQILHKEYPVYGWNQNCGYGTKLHIEAIKTYGQTIHHRVSFKFKGNINHSSILGDMV